jgi:aspartyl protease family protein
MCARLSKRTWLSVLVSHKDQHEQFLAPPWLWIAAICLAIQFGSVACRLYADEPKSGPKKSDADKAIPAEAKQALDAAGLKIIGANLALAGDNEVAKKVRDAQKQKKTFAGVDRELHEQEQAIEDIKNQILDLKTKHVQLNAQLATTADVTQHNQIVGALNAMAGQIELLINQQKTAVDNLKPVRAKASEAREEFVGQLLSLRASADETDHQWEKLAADADLQKAVDAINEATGKKFKLKPSPELVTAERNLKTMEQAILSESIPLTNDGGGLWANVVVDGKHSRAMVVDTGATVVSLPFAMAKEFGMEPTSQDEKVTVSLADGSEIPATRKKIDSLRVGKFIVENVDCVVLDASAPKATPLLGMSFLGKFKFELDKQKSELRMVKVDSGEDDAKPKSTNKTKPKKGK